MVRRFPISRDDCFPDRWPHWPRSIFITAHPKETLLEVIALPSTNHRLRQEAIFAFFATYVRPGQRMEDVLNLTGLEFWQTHFEIWHIEFQTGPPHPLNFDDGCNLFYARLLPFDPPDFRYQIDFAISDISEFPEMHDDRDVLLSAPQDGIIKRLAFDHPLYATEIHDQTGIRSPKHIQPDA